MSELKGRDIRHERKAAGLTQPEVAKEADTPLAVLIELENERLISPDLMRRVQAAIERLAAEKGAVKA